MKRIFTATLRRFGLLGNIQTSGWLSVILLCGVAIALTMNLGRVIANARNNYEVFRFEQSSLNEMKAEHDKLSLQLAFYESSEYKRLYARDYLHLAESSESLFQVVAPIEYYQLEANTFDPLSYKDSGYWWDRIL